MKITNFLFTFLLIGMIACNKNSTRPLLNTSNLQSSFITLSNDSSYTLKTSKGARLKIKAGSFKAEKGAKIILELKEAYNMQDILLSGLTTTSDGKLLNSSGMLYINASSNGKTAELLQPIEASIPSETYDENMQLFKGEVVEDSAVNWVDPTPLDTSAAAKNILMGRQLFKANCASCHYVFKELTGPRLTGLLDRIPNRQWYYDFMNMPTKMIAEDQYAYQLFLKWKPTVMTAFPNLRNDELDAILDYVENEEKLYPDLIDKTDTAFLVNSNTLPASLPCETSDTFFIAAKEPIIEIMKDTSTPKRKQQITETNSNMNDDEESDFIYEEQIDGMYDFNIDALGWYNIDAFKKESESKSNVIITAVVNTEEELETTIYLIVPEIKLFTYGKKVKNGSFVFDESDGSIPLETNLDAKILVVGSNKTDMFYGIQSFKVKASQQIQIDLQPTTEAAFKKMIEQNNIDGIKMDVLKKEFEVITRPCDETQNRPIRIDTSL